MLSNIKSVIAVTLIASACGAIAAAPAQISDEALSDVTGQDGVSILGRLNVNIGSFVYTNTDATTGGSMSINGIQASGFVGAVLSVVNQNTIVSGLIAPMSQVVAAGGAVANATGATPAFGLADLAGYYTGGDVLRIDVPAITNLPKVALLNVAVGSVRMGATTYDPLGNETQSARASFGSFKLNQIDLSGTQIFVMGHN